PERSWHPLRRRHAPSCNTRSVSESFCAVIRFASAAAMTGISPVRASPESRGAVVRLERARAFVTFGERNRVDLYEILGVSSSANISEIKAAFRRLAKELHPDCNAGNKAAERYFVAVQRAYRILCNADWRAAYDYYSGYREDVKVEPPDQRGIRVKPRWQRFWREAVKTTAAAFAFTLLFGAGALLWQNTSGWLQDENPTSSSLASANATFAPAISPQQLADVLYGSEAPYYSSEARMHRETITAAVELPQTIASVVIASFGDANTLRHDERVNHRLHPIDIVARIEGVRLFESGMRELTRGHIVTARTHFAGAVDRGLAIAATRLADTFDAR